MHSIGRYVYAGVTLVALAFALGVRPSVNEAEADRGGSRSVPHFQVDPFWPKPFPNRWQIGQVGGIAVDRHDRIWIIQRQRTLTADEAGAVNGRSDCCYYAPAVMVFDRAGNFVKGWGGVYNPDGTPSTWLATKCREADGCQWPAGEHGIFVDHEDNVWIGGNGNTPNPTPGGPALGDHMVLKFTNDGTFLFQIGRRGLTGGSNATTGSPNGTPLLGRPADVEVDPVTNEAYIADGYQNKRVLVVDAATGLYRRHWGAYGNVPVDADLGPYVPGQRPQQFRNPVHCVRVADDGLV